VGDSGADQDREVPRSLLWQYFRQPVDLRLVSDFALFCWVVVGAMIAGEKNSARAIVWVMPCEETVFAVIFFLVIFCGEKVAAMKKTKTAVTTFQTFPRHHRHLL
jgi:hypothetical protein